MVRSKEKPQGVVKFTYYQNPDDIPYFIENNHKSPMEIQFTPSIIISEEGFKAYINSIKVEIVEEAKIIIKENKEFYRNFDIDFSHFDFTGFSLIPNSNRMILRVINSHLRLKYRFIK